MASTTNYSWTTPDDTDLVKDGAAAIRTLGSAIDTTVFNNAGAAIAKTIVDAKGDLISATAADTPARLAVGTDGQYLQADSTTATGLKWGAISAGGMTVLSTTTLTGANTFSVTSISSAYTHLFIHIYDVTNGSNSTNKYRFNCGSSANCDSLWTYVANGGSVTQGRNFGENFTLDADQLITDSSSYKRTYGIWVYNYSVTSVSKNVEWVAAPNDGATKWIVKGIGRYNSSAAIDTITFSGWSGTNLTSGTMKIYGVN